MISALVLVCLVSAMWRSVGVCVEHRSLRVEPADNRQPVRGVPGIVVPLSIQNKNLWGLDLAVRAAAYVPARNGGRAVLMGIAEASSVSVAPQKVSTTEVHLRTASTDEDVPEDADDAAAAAEYFASRCGLALLRPGSTFAADMRVDLATLGMRLTLWLELELPCLLLPGHPHGAPLTGCGLPHCSVPEITGTPATGWTCFHLLCSVLDPMCEHDPCMHGVVRNASIASARLDGASSQIEGQNQCTGQ